MKLHKITIYPQMILNICYNSKSESLRNSKNLLVIKLGIFFKRIFLKILY
jgi:hypothetical protein